MSSTEGGAPDRMEDTPVSPVRAAPKKPRARPSAVDEDASADKPVTDGQPATAVLDDPVVIEVDQPINYRFKPVRVDPTKVKLAPQEKTKRYWIGAFTDAPFDNKFASSATFQKYTGIV